MNTGTEEMTKVDLFSPIGLGYLHVVEGDMVRAQSAIASGAADMVSFGQLYLANPDLVERFRTDAELNSPDPATFYGGDEKGYTDYPTLA